MASPLVEKRISELYMLRMERLTQKAACIKQRAELAGSVAKNYSQRRKLEVDYAIRTGEGWDKLLKHSKCYRWKGGTRDDENARENHIGKAEATGRSGDEISVSIRLRDGTEYSAIINPNPLSSPPFYHEKWMDRFDRKVLKVPGKVHLLAYSVASEEVQTNCASTWYLVPHGL